MDLRFKRSSQPEMLIYNTRKVFKKVSNCLDVDGYEDIDGGSLLRELTP